MSDSTRFVEVVKKFLLSRKDDDLILGDVIAAAVLAILLVALSTRGRRCRHPAVRFVVWVASTAFIPLTSSIIAALSPSAGDVSVDGQKVRPSVELFARGTGSKAPWWGPGRIAIFIAFCMVGFAKMLLKLGVIWRANGSFAVGKNARLVSGYMAQLVEDGEVEGHGEVPRYIVMGERKEHAEESPQGFRVKRDALEDKDSALVTLDRVWRLSDHGGDGLRAHDGHGSSSTSEHILACHVATRLFEIKCDSHAASASASADMIAACDLSYYCSYLVADSPAWTEKLYKDVVDDAVDAQDALAKKDGAMEPTYEMLVKELSGSSRNRVLVIKY